MIKTGTKLNRISGAPELSFDKAEKIMSIPKGNRPNPTTYLSKSDITNHLSRFDDGAVRVTGKGNINEFGTIGPSGGTFVMPKSEFDNILEQSNGNLDMVEKKLGLKTGSLQSGETVAVFIEPDDLQGLRMPSGNEAGTDPTKWIPGGFTSGGVPEAIIDAPPNLKHEILEF